jgi:hypothetical protein
VAPGPARQTPVHVDDPSFDSWEVVRDFGEVRTPRAWHQALDEAGSTRPDRRLAARSLRPRRHRPARPADSWSEAELLLSNLDWDEDDY